MKDIHFIYQSLNFTEQNYLENVNYADKILSYQMKKVDGINKMNRKRQCRM